MAFNRADGFTIQLRAPFALGPRERNPQWIEMFQEHACNNQKALSRHSPGFGSLAAVNYLTKQVHVRADMGSDHRMRRGNAVEYELSKLNLLLDSGNVAVPVASSAEARVSGAFDADQYAVIGPYNVWMPPLPDTLSSAPLMKSQFLGIGLSRPGFESTMSMEHLLIEIVYELGSHVESLSMWYQSDPLTKERIDNLFHFVDISSAVFLESYADRPTRDEATAMGINSIVLFSPRPLKALLDPTRYAFPTTDYAMSQEDNVKALLSICNTIRLRGENIEMLYLDRIGLLDVKVVIAMLAYMPKLRILSIFNCDLLHFVKLMTLVKLVVGMNQERRMLQVPPLQLDFFPSYEEAPAKHRSGCYGITGHDCGVDTLLGVVAHLQSVVRIARADDIDMFSPGRGFRLWLEKFPFNVGTLDLILESLYNILDFERDGLAQAFKVLPSPEDEPKRQEFLAEMKRAVHTDLLVAVRGVPQDGQVLTMPFRTCSSCYTEMLEAFWGLGRKEAPCQGCWLVHQLNKQIWKNKDKMKQLAGMLWRGKMTYSLRFLFNDGSALSAANRELAFRSARVFDDFLSWAEGALSNAVDALQYHNSTMVQLHRGDPQRRHHEEECRCLQEYIKEMRLRTGKQDEGSKLAAS